MHINYATHKIAYQKDSRSVLYMIVNAKLIHWGRGETAEWETKHGEESHNVFIWEGSD